MHGDQNEMAKLKKELEVIYPEGVNILAPRNCQTVKFNFSTNKSSKILGKNCSLFDMIDKVTIRFLTNFSKKDRSNLTRVSLKLLKFRHVRPVCSERNHGGIQTHRYQNDRNGLRCETPSGKRTKTARRR